MKNMDRYCEKLAVQKQRGVKDHPLVKLGRANIPMIAEEEKREGNLMYTVFNAQTWLLSCKSYQIWDIILNNDYIVKVKVQVKF